MQLLFGVCLSIVCSTFAQKVPATGGQNGSPIEGPILEPIFEMVHPSRPETGREHEERVLVAGIESARREAKAGAWPQWPQFSGPIPMGQRFFVSSIKNKVSS